MKTTKNTTLSKKCKKQKNIGWHQPSIWPNVSITRNGWLPPHILSSIIDKKTPPLKDKREIIEELKSPNVQIKIGDEELLVYEYSESCWDSLRVEWVRRIRLQFRLNSKGKVTKCCIYKL